MRRGTPYSGSRSSHHRRQRRSALGRRGLARAQHDVGDDHACRPAAPCGRARAPRRRRDGPAAPTATTPAETFAPPTLISSGSSRPVISTRPSSTSTRSPVRTAPSRPCAVVRRGDHQLVAVDRRAAAGPARRAPATRPGTRPGRRGRRSRHRPRRRRRSRRSGRRGRASLQLVEDGLVDRLATEGDLLQRHLGQARRRGVMIVCRQKVGVPEAAVTPCSSGGRDPAVEVGGVDHDQVLARAGPGRG